MILKLTELIENKYYLSEDGDDMETIFKYKSYDKYYIYCTGFKIFKYPSSGNLDYYELENNNIFCSINYYEYCTIFKEVCIDDFVYCLPDNNTDKKIYMRNKKIENLLCIM